MGHPLARIGGPVVRGHRLVVRREDRHEFGLPSRTGSYGPCRQLKGTE